jgi:hypothetical protein
MTGLDDFFKDDQNHGLDKFFLDTPSKKYVNKKKNTVYRINQYSSRTKTEWR